MSLLSFICSFGREYVRVEDTIKGCKELLEGRYDDVPDEAFWFVGTVEQALEKGKRLGGSKDSDIKSAMFSFVKYVKQIFLKRDGSCNDERS
ncbi:MAG: hypothetical protein AUH05_18230 [Ktedonobacter sp. 13_2_20CM_53_11]|nr:MAG: hypothetical protein AUH05_18230 [Ktedonobacter sp. 13_2_20CM_53_11]